MRNSCDTIDNVREKLADLRRAARKLTPSVKGSESERKAAAMKGYEAWADTRERANTRVPR